MANIIRVLAAHCVPLSDTLLVDAYEWTMDREGEGGVKELVLGDEGEALVGWLSAREQT